MISHFSADELADYRAGSISAGRAARIGAHLSGCSECSQLSSDLDGVSRLLSSIPVPPMPHRVTEHLQAIIAAEASQRTTAVPVASGAAGTAGTAGTAGSLPVQVPGRPDLPRRRGHRARRLRMPDWSTPLLLRGLAAAGVLVLLVGGGVLLANRGAVTGTPTAGRAPANHPAGSPIAEPRHSGVNAPAAAGAKNVRYPTGPATPTRMPSAPVPTTRRSIWPAACAGKSRAAPASARCPDRPLTVRSLSLTGR